MYALTDRIAVITGASSGIGRAIALGLAAQGAKLFLIGRRVQALEAVATVARKTAPEVFSYCINLTRDEDISRLKDNLDRDFGQVDLLIHSAGVFSMGTLQNMSVEELDSLYRVNVRAPYVLTQALLPMLLSSQGQIVFINSSAIMRARAMVGQYAATKSALKVIADSLGEEVNAAQVRVLRNVN